MEGDRKILLYEPAEDAVDSIGQHRKSYESPQMAFAIRTDRSGSESIKADTQVGSWSVRFELRWSAIWQNINPGWYLIDERNRSHDIESVTERPGTRRQWLRIYAVAREPV